MQETCAEACSAFGGECAVGITCQSSWPWFTGCSAVSQVYVHEHFYDGGNTVEMVHLLPLWSHSSVSRGVRPMCCVVKSSRCSPLAALVRAVWQLVVKALGVWHEVLSLSVHRAWTEIGQSVSSGCAVQSANGVQL